MKNKGRTMFSVRYVSPQGRSAAVTRKPGVVTAAYRDNNVQRSRVEWGYAGKTRTARGNPRQVVVARAARW